mmetsp:Transcript_1035/g.4012  ORF Transcript_1035/g.4012 Transcript_1035/m.4012 type:complete len:122 (+) Transcript_1035:3633-3998(+)
MNSALLESSTSYPVLTSRTEKKVHFTLLRRGGRRRRKSLSGLVSGAGAQVAWSLEKEVPLQEHASEAIGAVVHAAEASPFGRAAGEGSSGGGGGGGGGRFTEFSLGHRHLARLLGRIEAPS